MALPIRLPLGSSQRRTPSIGGINNEVLAVGSCSGKYRCGIFTQGTWVRRQLVGSHTTHHGHLQEGGETTNGSVPPLWTLGCQLTREKARLACSSPINSHHPCKKSASRTFCNGRMNWITSSCLQIEWQFDSTGAGAGEIVGDPTEVCVVRERSSCTIEQFCGSLLELTGFMGFCCLECTMCPSLLPAFGANRLLILVCGRPGWLACLFCWKGSCALAGQPRQEQGKLPCKKNRALGRGNTGA